MDQKLPFECVHKVPTASKKKLFKCFFWRMLHEDVEHLHYSCPQCGNLLVPGKKLMRCIGFSWSLLPILITGLVVSLRDIGCHNAMLYLLCLLGIGIIWTLRATVFSFLLLFARWVSPGFSKDLDEPAKVWYLKGCTGGFIAVLIFCGIVLLSK